MKSIWLLMGMLVLPGDSGEKKFVHPEGFSADLPFSPGIVVGDTLYVAGQTGRDLESGEFPESFEAEVRQVFHRIGLVLAAAGYDFTDVVDAKVYLTDIADFQAMNGVFREIFPKNPPVRTTVQVASLVGKARVEITVMARK